MAFTMSHELVHYIRDISPDMFRKLTECLSEIYYMEGMSLEELARARAERDDISYDTAFEESVAHSLERMLLDSDALEYLIKMKKRESGLFNRLRGHVDESYEHVKQLRAEYEGRKPESVEGRVLGHGTETILQAYEYAKDEQEKAYKAYAEAKDSASRKERIVELSEARKVLHAAEARLEQARTYTASMTKMYKRLHKLFAKAAYMASENGEIIRSSDRAWSEMTGNTDGKRYSLRKGAKEDVEKALTDFASRDDVYLTEKSPSIIIGHRGVKDLPLTMKASHVRENIFSKEEAREKGLPTSASINYHGLGKELFLDIINDLDNVTLAYRGTRNAKNTSRRENYFLLISQHKDKHGDIINIPVYINGQGQYNRVLFGANKVATVFGKKNFSNYIQREIKNGNLVKIKNRSTQVSERTAPIAGGYNSNASNSIITQADSESQPLSENNSKKYQRRRVSEGKRDVFGFEVSEKADINEELLEELSIHDPSARVDENGNITVYHRTTKASADEIRRTGIMRAKEDMLFFSSQPDGYATDYGDEIMQFTIPSTKLEVNDIFDGEVHFDIPLQRRGTGWSLNVRDYITEDTKKYQRRENIEELLFDDSFYSQFENENRSRITESVSELRERLDGMTDENSTFEEQHDVRAKIKALNEGYTSLYDYYVGHEKQNVLREYEHDPKKFEKKLEKKEQEQMRAAELQQDIKNAPPHKLAQYNIIQVSNPMWNEYHVGIRSPKDIKTFDEVINDGESFAWGDFDIEDAKSALKKGTVRVYSSYPIRNGVFVSTSYQQALDYAAGETENVHSRVVALDSVAWINGDEGQYAKVYKNDIDTVPLGQ